jgi:hypothetical protein
MDLFSMTTLIPPSEIEIGFSLKRALGWNSKDPVKVADRVVMVRDNIISYHDLYHLEVSCLPRILMGKHQVSGIHGINSPILHDHPIVEEYNSLLDEARISFHEFLTRTSIFTIFKLVGWMLWLIFQGINPASVFIRHFQVVYNHNIFLPLVEQMNFVDADDTKIQSLLKLHFYQFID